ncbi:MAG: hypothetical protein Q4A11_01100 [Brachymonas sp.]|nr:hypothetical protein [Brachymonas sp.]
MQQHAAFGKDNVFQEQLQKDGGGQQQELFAGVVLLLVWATPYAALSLIDDTR